MKSAIKLIFAVEIIAGLSGCDELITFDMNYAVDLTIPGSTVLNLPLARTSVS